MAADPASDAIAGSRRTRVFISYARSDMAFADRLDTALTSHGFEPFIDRRDIAPREEWWPRIQKLIAQADTVVFILSPDAVASRVCLREAEYAESLHKRFAPILYSPVSAKAVPEALGKLNWIFFDDPARFSESVDKLVEALSVDIAWIRKHTELGEAARRWDAAGRPGPHGILLRPPLLIEAEGWIKEGHPGTVLPGPAEEIGAFIAASRVAFELEEIARLAKVSEEERLRGNEDTALRLAVHAARRELSLRDRVPGRSEAAATLAASVWESRCLLILSGHWRSVRSAAFSEDGSRIVTGSRDDSVRIWDAETGKEIAVLPGHGAAVTSAAFSPDGSTIVTGGERSPTGLPPGMPIPRPGDAPAGPALERWNETARICDAGTGKKIAVLRGHAGDVTCAAYSPDGLRIVTASSDMTARIWNVPAGQEIAILSGHAKAVRSAAFSPDGLRIVTASDDGTARIWDAAAGVEIAVLRGHEGAVLSAAFSPSGSHIITASKDITARIWDAETREELKLLGGHERGVNAAAFSPDGSRIVTASDDGTARIWDAAAGAEIAVLRGHGEAVNSAAFSHDGARIITASDDGTARIWDATRPELKVLRGHGEVVNSARFSPDGSRIVTASDDKTARIWDAVTGDELGVLLKHDRAVKSAAFSPDGSRIVTVSQAATGSSAYIWDAESGKQIAIRHGDLGAFSPDGSRIVTVSIDRAATVWDVVSGEKIADLGKSEGGPGRPPRFVLTPDGTPIITSGTLSPDGSLIAALDGNTARVQDAGTRKVLAVMRGHRGAVTSAAFSPGGSRAVTASRDRTARIWDTANGKEIAILRGHGGEVTSAAFSPDGSRIVTASRDRTARVWDAHFAAMPANRLIAEVCTRRLRGLTGMSRDEMRLAGYPDGIPRIDVCDGIPGSAPPVSSLSLNQLPAKKR